MASTVRVLMCPPTHFDVRYAINPWMDAGQPRVQPARALAQWRALAALVSERAQVLLVEPGAGLADMCFAANGGLVCGDTFVASRFRHHERRGEESLYAAWFRARGYDCHALPDGIVFEGAGDALFDADGSLWMGHGQRSELAAADALARLLRVRVTPLRLVDPRFYHLDTCFCPLSTGDVLYFPAAFDAPSRAAIEARFAPHRRIAVGETDACAFACNAIDLGDRLLLNQASDALRGAIERTGLAVRTTALDEFLKSGGAAKCLALPLDRVGAPRAMVELESAAA